MAQQYAIKSGSKHEHHNNCNNSDGNCVAAFCGGTQTAQTGCCRGSSRAPAFAARLVGRTAACLCAWMVARVLAVICHISTLLAKGVPVVRIGDAGFLCGSGR